MTSGDMKFAYTAEKKHYLKTRVIDFFCKSRNLQTTMKSQGKHLIV